MTDKGERGVHHELKIANKGVKGVNQLVTITNKRGGGRGGSRPHQIWLKFFCKQCPLALQD